MLTECNEELPNPHKSCLREMLNTLIISDNDVKRLNTQLRNIQLEMKAEMDKIEKSKCVGDEKSKKPKVCDSEQDLTQFAERIVNLDELKLHYTKKSEELRRRRDNIMVYARQCLNAYNEEKCKFKSFQENTVDYIKRTATLSQDHDVVKKCEYDICQMNKRFVREVAHLKRCEGELLAFIKLLKDSDPKAYCECCCFKEYDWLPQGKNLEVVDTLAEEIKQMMGQVLVRAFAQLHVHEPQDPRAFIAAYLMNLDRSEQEMLEKHTIIQEATENCTKQLPDPTFHCENACPPQAKAV
ncbi:uncharacterized protein LOC117586261 [Drosophila guanche]|uniref:Uncharacterized protein n=1 Tax=Drosophila guanche TaxID=7266 RepID=A0A3B0KDH1_DROGU|nr:uncharacterized protein LOC117586261 [Drosophila guanche]SPP83786.1 Hypothetical predicted protein [Drosophila guanche]